VTPDTDILVIDNASTDGSLEMLSADFPQVRVLALPENLGCAARNVAVAEARGDIVMTLDNDVILETLDAANQIVDIFAENASLACVTFKILGADGRLSRRDWCHPRDWQSSKDQAFHTYYVLEGASAFRRESFLRVGGYWPPFFLGHEGLDLGLRFLARGFTILYSPQIEVTHLASPLTRPTSRIYYTFTRNSIWVAIRNHRLWPAFRSILVDLLLMAFASTRAGQFRSYARGLRDGLLGVPEAIRSRQPLSRRQYEVLRTLREQEPGPLAKLARHWRERLI
jgi:GT2 family glycosyltransferase